MKMEYQRLKHETLQVVAVSETAVSAHQCHLVEEGRVKYYTNQSPNPTCTTAQQQRRRRKHCCTLCK